MNRYRLVTFDVTGTLLKFRKSVGEQYAEIGEHFGVVVNPDLLTKHFNSQWKVMTTQHPNFGLHSSFNWKHWWRLLVFKTFSNALNHQNVDYVKLLAIADYLTDLYRTSKCWKLNDGAWDILNELYRNKIKMGIISNYDASLEEILKDMDIDHYFHFIINSYTAGFQKPDVRIFKLAQNKGNISTPKNIIHVGDNVHLDYKGAINAGWNACLIQDGDVNTVLKLHPHVDPKFIFNNLSSLKESLFYSDTYRISNDST